MGYIHILLLASFGLVAHGQGVCPTDGCTENDVALLKTPTTSATDNFYIGGLFGVRNEGADPYSCGSVRVRGLVNAEAFFWAIKKYSVSAGLTTSNPPIHVGGFVMDSCSRSERSIENIYSFETCRTRYSNVDPRSTMAYVGPDRSSEAMETAMLLKDMNRTQVTHAATSPMLSDNMYNYLLRTVPSDATQTEVMAKLLNFKSIKYVQVLYADSAYGKGLLHAFEMNAKQMNVCITGKEKLEMDSSMVEVKALLRSNTVTRYVILLADNVMARAVLKMVDGVPELSGKFVFVGTSSWGEDSSVIDDVAAAENAITLKLVTGSTSIASDVAAFWDDFYNMVPSMDSNSGDNVNTHNPWFNDFWEQTFSCSLEQKTCDLPTQDLRNIVPSNDVYIPYTLMAVKAIILGVQSSALKYCQGPHLCSEFLNRNSRGPALFEGILNAKDRNQRFFQDNGDTAVQFEQYKVMQVKDGVYLNVLDYDKSQGFSSNGLPSIVMTTSTCPNSPCLQCGEQAATTQPPSTTTTTLSPVTAVTKSPEELIAMLIDKYFMKDQEFTGVWRSGQERSSDDSKTRFENGQDWIIALGVLAGLGIVCVLTFEIYILYKLMGTKIGKQWRTMWLGQLLLFGLFCCYLTLFAYLFTPTKATCGITRFGVGVSYSICFGVLLVKLMVLLTSKNSSETLIPGDVDSPNYLRGIYQFLMFVFVVGVQVVIAAQWLIQVPPDAVKVMSNSGDMVWICNHYTWSLAPDMGWDYMPNFVRTNFENHLISLVYVMFLILLTTIVAMKAHGIITNHRESVFIGIAAGFSIPVMVAWALVGGLNRDHAHAHEFGDACIAFGLFITATMILFAMFLPKVRQLVNMGVEGIYLEDDRDTYYAGSVIMAPPSYKSRPSSVVYVNNGYNDPVVIGDQNAVHLKHPGSTYSAPVYVKRPESTIGGHSGKVLKMTGDLTGKHPRESKRSVSEAGYMYAGSEYGTYRKSQSERGGTLKKAHSHHDLGAL